MSSQAFWRGYVSACAERGVNPQLLVKQAADKSTWWDAIGALPGQALGYLQGVPAEYYGALAGAGLGGYLGNEYGGLPYAALGALAGGGAGYGGVAGGRALSPHVVGAYNYLFGDPRPKTPSKPNPASPQGDAKTTPAAKQPEAAAAAQAAQQAQAQALIQAAQRAEAQAQAQAARQAEAAAAAQRAQDAVRHELAVQRAIERHPLAVRQAYEPEPAHGGFDFERYTRPAHGGFDFKRHTR